MITQDTTLDSDLACASDGIVIGAGDVTLDLDGHRISGTMASASAGVRVRGPYDEYLPKISITNGTVAGFQVGISMAWSDAALRDLRLERNGTGFASEWMGDVSIIDTVAVANLGRASAIGKATEHGPAIHDVLASRNGGSGIAVSYGGNGGFTLEDSVATDNGDFGLFLYKVSNSTGSVARNRITGNAGGGLYQQYCGAVDAIGNVIAYNGGDGVSQTLYGLRASRQHDLSEQGQRNPAGVRLAVCQRQPDSSERPQRCSDQRQSRRPATARCRPEAECDLAERPRWSPHQPHRHQAHPAH